ncbi:late embryogenesis abundant protein D-34-like [Prosopis cineraria]|uniref:late embryogenesis abundant protein D-34-like n=1 Tax=Prosopis cineraria TaxID=364024 RepID=UPI0024104F9D|nr:late embryogenesis abundant protein D-34-like [Prosopis cineraria]
MSQEQPRRGAEDDQEPIKYGDVFVNVKGSELASKPVAPRDAAIMQSAEAQVLGATQKGGPAALMESAAAINERVGLVSHYAVTNLARNQGVTISETNEGRGRVVTQTLGGQVVGKYMQPVDAEAKKRNNNSGTDDAVNESAGDAASAWMQAPGFKASIDDDFISEQGDATLNPRLVRKADDNNFVPSENVISGIPGGMGASMATADQRVKKNK